MSTNVIDVRCQGSTFWTDLEIVKSCPGRSFDPKSKLWKIPATDENMELLEQISYLKHKLNIIREQKKLSTMDLNERSKQISEEFPFLFDYQATGAQLLFDHNAFLIADDMGLGKTVQCMPIIQKYSIAGKRIIIIAPSSLLRQWNSEMKRFIGMSGEIVQGMAKDKRLKTYKNSWITLTTYESFWRDCDSIDLEWSNVVLITDEASKYKNKDTKIWANLNELRDRVYKFIALTGTPVENSLINFFNIISIIEPNFMSKKEFYTHYCEWDPFGGGIVGYKHLDEFLQRVSPLMIRRKKTDVHNLPEKIIQNRVIPMTKEQKLVAKGIRKFVGDENAIQGLVLLREVANDTYLIENSQSEMVRLMKQHRYLPFEIPVASNKLSELDDILDEVGVNQKVLIFTMWSTEAHRIGDRIKEKHKEINYRVLTGDSKQDAREKAIQDFKDDKFQVLIATDIFGYGINLQFVDILINFDIPWNPAKLNQRIDRIHRIGAKNDKLIINFISEDIDEKVKEVLDKKQDLFDAVVDGKAITDDDVRAEILQKLK